MLFCQRSPPPMIGVLVFSTLFTNVCFVTVAGKKRGFTLVPSVFRVFCFILYVQRGEKEKVSAGGEKLIVWVIYRVRAGLFFCERLKKGCGREGSKYMKKTRLPLSFTFFV